MATNRKRLTKQQIAEAAKELARRDPKLRAIHSRLGPPPLLRRPANFATLIQIILEQQVSVESAKATFDRLVAACQNKVVPESLSALGEDQLRKLGFSRQKSRYAVKLASDCIQGDFQISTLSKLDDTEVRKQITSRLGLGDWSADVYLLMALLRADILPIGDLALVNGIKQIDGQDYDSRDQILQRSQQWRPFRSVATRMVWQWYVDQRGRDIF